MKLVRQSQGGEAYYIVKDPVIRKYFRFGALEGTVFKYLDGNRSFDEVASLVSKEMGLTVIGSHIQGFVESVRKHGFLEQSAREKSLFLLEHLREERKQTAAKAGRSDLFYQRFPLWDPDELYNKLMKPIGVLWTRPFVTFFLCLFALAATIIISNWSTVSAGLTRLRSFENPTDAITFVVVLLIVIFFHENGHGLTCKRFGGEVHEVGFMLIYFMPAFYANVSDAWTFERKAPKLWVTFAGAFVELIISSIASFIWFFSAPGYLTHDIAFTVMLVSGLSSILVNMNPLIKLDGYFALVDYLEVPGLGDDSMKYISLLARKHLFRMPVRIPEYPARIKRIYLIYGLLSLTYKIFFLFVVLSLFNRIINKFFPDTGALIFPVVALLLLRKKLGSLVNAVRSVVVDKKETVMRPKHLAIATASAAMVFAFLFLVPMPYSHKTTFVAEPSERSAVRAETSGFIDRIEVKEGDEVKRGALLATMRNIDLEQKRDDLFSRLALIDREIRVQQAQAKTAEAIEGKRRRDQIEVELRESEALLERLQLTSPVDGIVLTPKLGDRVGAALRTGEEFCELGRKGPQSIRVAVDDWDLEDVQAGARASLRIDSSTSITGVREIEGRVASVAPASNLFHHFSPASNTSGGMFISASLKPSHVSATSRSLSTRAQVEAVSEATSPFDVPLTRFEAVISIGPEDSDLKPGMSGDVKIYGPSRSLGIRAWQAGRDWFRSQIWW